MDNSADPARRDYHPARPPLFPSRILGESRRYRVYLPRGYAQDLTRRYPVLYMQDGQNIFERGAFGTWDAAPTLDRLTASGQIEELIVVAVDHGPRRHPDYIPPEDGGEADRYSRFLAEELKPFVDARYRTLTGADNTGVLGSSLGGVAALYTAWNHSHVFGKVASMSGSWWLRGWRSSLSGKRPLRCYLDSGDAGYASDSVFHTRALKTTLEQLGWSNDDLLHSIGKGDVHTETAWARRLEHPLRFLFPARPDQALPLAI